MSLLTIVQDACDRMSLPRPTVVMTSQDQLVASLRGLAQQESTELARRAAWQALKLEHTFITTAAAVQVGGFPSDFDYYVDETMFNRSRRRSVWGPLSDQEWQRIQASLTTLVDPAFRIRGSQLLISPTPPAGETIAYEYVTKNFCRSSLSVAQSRWEADDDETDLDEELITLGVIWRHKKAKGFDYAEDFRSYELTVAERMKRDGARPRISTIHASNERVPTAPQVPDTIVP